MPRCSSCGKQLKPIRMSGGVFSSSASIGGGGSPSQFDMWRAQVCETCKFAFCGDCIELGYPTPCPQCGNPTVPAFQATLIQMGPLKVYHGHSLASKSRACQEDDEAFVFQPSQELAHDIHKLVTCCESHFEDALTHFANGDFAAWSGMPEYLKHELQELSQENISSTEGLRRFLDIAKGVAKKRCNKCASEIQYSTAYRFGGLCARCAIQSDVHVVQASDDNDAEPSLFRQYGALFFVAFLLLLFKLGQIYITRQ